MSSAAERRAAQRQLAKDLREGNKIFPANVTNAYKTGLKHSARAYANDVLDGKTPRPDKGSDDAKVLARAASYAAHDDDYYDYEDYDYGDLEDFWYHEVR